ncbi:MAG: cyclic nucleotide-binding domain-containing protein [Anaerolineae bacterium]|nr:cyclic nucleotide-binding domain-containing protein [Anaerolineae bacterium]
MALDRLTPEELTRLLARKAMEEEPVTPPGRSPWLPLFASLDRSALSHLMSEVTFAPGEIVCLEGEAGDAMFLIWSGRIAVVKGPLDNPIILSCRGAGEIIGEMALLEDQPRSATTIALDHLRALRIGHDQFHEWLGSSPDISMNIMSTLSARLRAADDIRIVDAQIGQQLEQQVETLQSENAHLIALQRVRKETSDLVVHDLRNPLGSITGVFDMLEVVLPPDVLETNRELLDIGHSACQRMVHLVDSLLDVAKLETGEFVVRLAVINLRPLLEEAVKRQSIAVRLHNIEIALDCPDQLPAVMADCEVLHRVLGNLLDNALKYSPSGHTITLTCAVDAGYITVSVTDQGPGIPAEERERIFERFAQIENRGVRKRGFGLGLTFCKLAIEAHNGHIWVEPGPDNVGSQFVFTLPYA